MKKLENTSSDLQHSASVRQIRCRSDLSCPFRMQTKTRQISTKIFFEGTLAPRYGKFLKTREHVDRFRSICIRFSWNEDLSTSPVSRAIAPTCCKSEKVKSRNFDFDPSPKISGVESGKSDFVTAQFHNLCMQRRRAGC